MNSPDVFAALIEPLRRAVAEEGYTVPTPIQEQAIPHILEAHDLLGCAQTGTGKTAAFTLPMLQELARHRKSVSNGRPRCLIITPTRELAGQIGDSIKTYGRHLKIRHTVIFGGVGQKPQEQMLRKGVEVVVATPGRLLDLMGQGHVRLDRVEIFILDEADRMLDMGFIPSIHKMIAQLPEQRQSLFFSATMPPAVAELSRGLLRDPVRITIAPEQPTIDKIDQKVLFVDKGSKDALLLNMINEENIDKLLVFTRTKRGADKVVKKLQYAGIESSAIHGNKSQTVRTRALQGFKSGRTRVLVATDIAARGLDVDGITHVFNYDLPEEPETYIHRIGRTARAGAGGNAVSFCSARERNWLRGIERTIRNTIPIEREHGYHSEDAFRAQGADARPESARGANGRPSNSSRKSGDTPSCKGSNGAASRNGRRRKPQRSFSRPR